MASTVFMGNCKAMPTLVQGTRDHISGMVLLDSMEAMGVVGTITRVAAVREETSDNQGSMPGMAINGRWQHRQETWVWICMGKVISKGVQHRVIIVLKRKASELGRGLKVRHAITLNSIKHWEERKMTRMASKGDNKRKYAADGTKEEVEEAPSKK
jgi:hypothetical protein